MTTIEWVMVVVLGACSLVLLGVLVALLWFAQRAAQDVVKRSMW